MINRLKKYNLFFFTVLLSLNTQAQTKKVLFLGNSYTGVNNLPMLVHDIAISTGDTIVFDKNTPGGMTLSGHASNANTQNKIKSDDWDYVVIQAQSQEPSFPIQQVQAQTFPFAEEICDSIRANNSCSRPIFYMTWGRENGDANNCAAWPPICTYEGMDSLLNLRYRMMADMNDGYVSPVGAVWHYLRDNYPNIELYANDGSHPSKAGSYAAACTFYSIIMQKDPTLIEYNYTLPDSTAEAIKIAAKTIAFDDLNEWNIGDYDPVANFTFVQNENVLSFTNTSVSFDSLYWNFGDEAFSTETNPSYTYPNTEDSYLVTLTALNCGVSNTLSEFITITLTEVNEIEGAALNLYPNPVVDIFFIKNPENHSIEVKVYDAEGKLLLLQENPTQISLAEYSAGLYIVLIENIKTGQQFRKKIFFKG